MRGPSNKSVAVLAVTASTGSLSLGYFLVRRFRRRLNQSKALRAGRVSRPDAASLAVGDYVRVRGTVSAGARTLESPMKRVPCVSYRVNVVRVVDSRTAKKKASVGGIWGVLGGIASVVPWLCSFAATAQVDTEKWDTVYQAISSRGETVEFFLDDHDSIADLEAVAQAGTGKRRPRVRVDLAGAEFFAMEQVASEFEAEKATGKVSSRTQLGYRTTEEVLAVGSRLIVLGEVGDDPEGAEGDVVLRKAAPSSILDLKTTSISRPFVASIKSEQGLLQEIERSGRIYFWLALPSVAVGLAFAYVGVLRVLAAIEDRSMERPALTESGPDAPPASKGLLGWRRG
ncbi:unnamed protein product [Ectocarpus sp. 12 AP-2014]